MIDGAKHLRGGGRGKGEIQGNVLPPGDEDFADILIVTLGTWPVDQVEGL